MHIVTKNPFDKKVVEHIMDELHKHGVNNIAKGETYTPSWLWVEWFHNIFKSPVKVIISQDNLYVAPGRLGGLYRGVSFSADDEKEEQFVESEKEKRTETFSLVRIHDITGGEFSKHHFWNLTGTLVMEFDSHSIRKDQTDITSSGIIVMFNMCSWTAKQLLAQIGC